MAPFYPSSGYSTKHYQSMSCTAIYPTWFMSVEKIRCLKDLPKIMSSIDSLDCFPKQPHESPGPNVKRCGTHRDHDGDSAVPYATGRRETSPGMSRLGRPSATYTVIPGELTHSEETTHFLYFKLLMLGRSRRCIPPLAKLHKEKRTQLLVARDCFRFTIYDKLK